MSQFVDKLNCHHGNIEGFSHLFPLFEWREEWRLCFHLCPQQYNAMTHELQACCVHKATVCDGAGSQENTSRALLGAVRLRCGQVRCEMCLVGDAIR